MHRTLAKYTDVVLGDELAPLQIDTESSTAEQAFAEGLKIWAPHAQVMAVRFPTGSVNIGTSRLVRPMVHGRVYSACKGDRRHIMLQVEAADHLTPAVSAMVELRLASETRQRRPRG